MAKVGVGTASEAALVDDEQPRTDDNYHLHVADPQFCVPPRGCDKERLDPCPEVMRGDYRDPLV